MTTDVQGKTFKVGQRVARASKYYRIDGLHVVVCKVTRLKNGKVYLDDSPRVVNFPERLAIISAK